LANGTYSSDFWRFSLDTLSWTQLPVDAPARAACASELVGDRIWFFGGVGASGPVQDLHYLDLSTLALRHPATTGDLPPPGSHPFMVHWRDSLILWENIPTGSRSFFYVLDTVALHWTRVPSEFVYRLGATGAVVDGKLFVFGSSMELTVLVLNLTDLSLSNVRTSGIEPPEGIAAVAVGHVIFAFETGGAGARKRLFAFDCERLTWHSYAAESAELEGSPAVVFYDEDGRRVLGVWESDECAGIGEIEVGEPLGVLSHAFDMLGQLVGH
jgi:hypothetical protein